MRSWYPKAVSLLGILGLASALLYAFGVYLVFSPAHTELGDWFLRWALPLLVVPYVLLVGYLFIRARTAAWLLEHGRRDEAMDYCRANLAHTVLRSRTEAMMNRACLGRALVERGEYAEALAVLDGGGSPPKRGQVVLPLARWKMEAALRLENLVACHAAYDAVAETTRPRAERAYVLACRAELAVREGDRAGWTEALEQARWADATDPRVRISEALGRAAFATDERDRREALDLLAELEPGAIDQIPGRQAEVLALQAQLAFRLGDERAAELLDRARRAPQDDRSRYVVERTERMLEPDAASHTAEATAGS